MVCVYICQIRLVLRVAFSFGLSEMAQQDAALVESNTQGSVEIEDVLGMAGQRLYLLPSGAPSVGLDDSAVYLQVFPSALGFALLPHASGPAGGACQCGSGLENEKKATPKALGNQGASVPTAPSFTASAFCRFSLRSTM